MTGRSVPTCHGCGAKFAHDAELARCRSCGLPDEVAANGKQAIIAWQQLTLENKRLFGRMHAREARQDRKPKKQQKRGAETWLARAKAKHKEARQHA